MALYYYQNIWYGVKVNLWEGQTARWLEQIAEYDLVIQHRPGRKHGNADGLSRPRCKQCGREENAGTEDVPDPLNKEVKNVRSIAAKPTLGHEDLRKAQLEDESLEWLMRAKEREKWDRTGKPFPIYRLLPNLTGLNGINSQFTRAWFAGVMKQMTESLWDGK